MPCPKCIAPKWNTQPCAQFRGFHRFCHSCGFVWMQHTKEARVRCNDHPMKPTLTVIDGGATEDDDARQFGAWIDGEVMR
jgi:hypothetical protein